MKVEILMPRFQSRRTIVVSLFLGAMAFGLLGMNLRPAHALPLYSVNQTNSGLVGSDPLTGSFSQAQLAGSSFWFFGGDAALLGAPYAYNEDSGGLHIGVQSPASGPYAGNYAGYYALHIANGMLFHAVLTAPSRTVPSGYPNVGLYVQTGGVNVDYIVCGGTTSSGGTFWGAALATGGPNAAFTYQPLYLDMSPNQALTRDCTIITNGANYLAVYLDNSLVYQSSNQNLGYQAPFQIFLETQTSYTGGMFTGTFNDFYMTSSDSITVTNMPISSTAQIVGLSGQVFASAPADGSGRATLPIGQYHMPLVGNIQITQLGLVVGSTSSPVSIWGGDSFSVSLPLGLAGGLVSAGQGSGGASPSVAEPARATTAPVVVGAVQGTSAPSLVGGAASAAPTAKAVGGPVSALTSAPLTALSLLGILGGSNPRKSFTGQERPC